MRGGDVYFHESCDLWGLNLKFLKYFCEKVSFVLGDVSYYNIKDCDSKVLGAETSPVFGFQRFTFGGEDGFCDRVSRRDLFHVCFDLTQTFCISWISLAILLQQQRE